MDLYKELIEVIVKMKKKKKKKSPVGRGGGGGVRFGGACGCVQRLK